MGRLTLPTRPPCWGQWGRISCTCTRGPGSRECVESRTFWSRCQLLADLPSNAHRRVALQAERQLKRVDHQNLPTDVSERRRELDARQDRRFDYADMLRHGTAELMREREANPKHTPQQHPQQQSLL